MNQRCERFRHRTRIPLQLFAAFLLLKGFVGCGYVVGSAFPPEVRTIEIPIFTSSSYRRGIEFQLTEAVQKEVQRRTHFRIVKGPEADTRLTGRIVEIQKDVLGENRFDEPRELQWIVAIEVIWEDLRNDRVLMEQRIPINPQLLRLSARATMAPEIGQSRATALQEAVDRLAEDIVDRMEIPW